MENRIDLFAEAPRFYISSIEQEKRMSSVFISHSSKDKTVVEKLLPLLTIGVGLHSADVFCTSLGGLGVPVGKDDWVRFG